MLCKFSLTTFSVLATLSLPSLAEPSSSDLICHTSELSECYPRIFQPSTDFQIIRDDQDIPPGLHVRLNIQTGLTEAKLYNAKDDDDSALSSTVEVFPEGEASASDDEHHKDDVNDPPTIPDTSIIPLDDEPARDHAIDAPPADYSPPASNAQIPIPPELLQHVLHGGDRTIKRPLDGDADATTFTAALGHLSNAAAAKNKDQKNKKPTPPPPRELLHALATLEDLAHDIYWGLTLAQSPGGAASLAALLRSADPEVGSAAALALGNTVHNNPKALGEVLGKVPGLAREVQELLFAEEAVSGGGKSTGVGQLPARQYTRLLFLLSSLLAGPESGVPAASAAATAAEGSRDGMHGLITDRRFHTMLEHFRVAGIGSEGDDKSNSWDRPRQAIADFVLDRLASAEAHKRFTTLEWRIWEATEGFANGRADGDGAPLEKLHAEADVEAQGGEEAGWRRVVAGDEAAGVRPMWVRAGTREERAGGGVVGGRVAEPRRYEAWVVEALSESCRTFEAAVGRWEGGRAAASAELGAAEEHARETLGEVRARLREIGCDCRRCAFYATGEGREKTEL